VSLRVDLTMSPTYVPDLAGGVVEAMHQGLRGLVHLAGGKPATWFDVAHDFIKAANVKAKVRRLYAGADPIRRPLYSVLESERMSPLPAWSDHIEEYLRLWNGNRS